MSWYVYDGLGSVVEEVDPSGNVTASRKYDVYGLVRSGQAGSSSEKYVGRLGHESDGSTGLIYMQARYMDPVLGRFISEDPSRDGVNWYTYCSNDPINHCDNNGRTETPSLITLVLTFLTWLYKGCSAALFFKYVTDMFVEIAKPYRLDPAGLLDRIRDLFKALRRGLRGEISQGMEELAAGTALDDTDAVSGAGAVEAGNALVQDALLSFGQETLEQEVMLIEGPVPSDQIDYTIPGD